MSRNDFYRIKSPESTAVAGSLRRSALRLKNDLDILCQYACGHFTSRLVSLGLSTTSLRRSMRNTEDRFVKMGTATKQVCEVARPLSCNLKGGYHINCPFGYVGWGRVRVVTLGPILLRHGIEAARRNCGSYPARGACKNRRP